MKRLVLFLVIILGAVAIAGFPLFTKPAFSANAVDWNAGRIIDDDVFFNGTAMSVQEIQNFLNSQAPACDTWGNKMYSATQTRAQYGQSVGAPAPFICLKDYYENPTTHETNFNSTASVPAGALSAAQIIYNVSATFNISPKVLLVTLKKEAPLNLIGDDWPMLWQYRTSMGYGCPDTAPCDAQYYGFYNQMYNAARQFRLYASYPESYRYKAFKNNYVQYNPNTGCGGSSVYIQGQATAGLYSYTPYQPNSAALNNLYGTGDACSAYGNRNFWRIYTDWFGSTQSAQAIITYQSQLSETGWTNSTRNTGITGTVGLARPMESFKIIGDVSYSSYNVTTGWQPTVSNGMVSGTVGLARPIQALQITLGPSLTSQYDIWYRVHVSNIGWMGWVKNGAPAGITASSNNIEALEIYLSPKDANPPGDTTNAYQNNGTVTYDPPLSLKVSAHVQNVGWQPQITNDMIAGTLNQSLRMEALKLNLENNTGLSGDIVYQVHVENVGWQDTVANGATAGTTGQGLRMEAVRMLLTGQLGDSYDIWYNPYIQNNGWLGWAKNGQAAGSVGVGLRLEAFRVLLAPKGTLAIQNSSYLLNPNNVAVPDTYNLSYATHLSNIGWVSGVVQNKVGGTTGQARPMEALRFDSLSSMFGGDLGINCSAYVKGSGWMNNVTPGNTCGTTGQAKPLQAIKLQLTGTTAGKYDIYYQVHLSTLGWQSWVNNGTQAGIPDGNTIEAIVIKLVQK